MDNGQRTIRSLFDGTKEFRIPKYQRAFAWEDKQLTDFVDDLRNQDIDKAYFMGTILFQEHAVDEFFEVIDIVDGQQRITTVVIFMKLLLDHLERLGKDVRIERALFLKTFDRFKLRVLDTDNDFFHTYILGDHPIVEGIMTTPSQHRLKSAKAFLAGKVGELTEPQALELKMKLSSTRILTYSVTSAADATLIFETTNDRGKALSNLEKTKSFLMYKTYLAHQNPDVQLRDLQDRFSQIYRDYEQVQHLISENNILQYHFIAFEEWKAKQDKKDYYDYVGAIKSTINGRIKEDPDSCPQFIDRYSRELRESYAITREMLEERPGFLPELRLLNRLASFYPLLIKVWKCDDTADRTWFRQVSRLCEIHAFRVIGIGRKKSNTGRANLYYRARDFRGDFPKLLENLVEMIMGYSRDETFQRRLMSPDFYKEIFRTDQRYLFWQYENHLRQTEQPVVEKMGFAEFASENSKVKLTIEHIAAQHPRKGIVAKKAIMPYIGKRFRETHLHCLGNLTFDPLSANASKSNLPFNTKDERYFRRAPFKTQNELETFIGDNQKWDDEAIERRRQKIIKFAMRFWDPRLV